MAENKEELKSFLIKVQEESKKGGLKLNFQKTKIMASSPITAYQINGETMETVTDFILEGLQKHCRCCIAKHFSYTNIYIFIFIFFSIMAYY